jgi:hypothetical protein
MSMNSHWSDEQIEAAVAQAVREAGLHRVFAPLVRAAVVDTSDGWRVCCESDCEPCVKNLEPAVDRARELLGAG